MTSILASLPPGRSAFGAGEVARAQEADLRAVVAVNPGRAGFNSFDVYLRDSLGRSVDKAEKVALLIGKEGDEAGTTEAVAESAGGGRYSTVGGFLSSPGEWDANLLVRRPGKEDVRIPITLIVSRAR